jgi:hypothetical protein
MRPVTTAASLRFDRAREAVPQNAPMDTNCQFFSELQSKVQATKVQA